MSNPTVAASCIICAGTKVWKWGDTEEPCRSCADPDALLVRRVLGMLEPKHMAFLRAYNHTLAYQPVTPEEWDTHTRFFVDDDDAVIDEGCHEVLMPATSHWFGGGMARMAHGSIGVWHRYTPLGLALRDCLMAGSDAAVR